MCFDVECSNVGLKVKSIDPVFELRRHIAYACSICIVLQTRPSGSDNYIIGLPSCVLTRSFLFVCTSLDVCEPAIAAYVFMKS